MDEPSAPVFVLACISCGKTVSGGEKVCPRCGASFENLRFECPFCGELVSPSDTCCHSCKTEFALFAGEVEETSSIDLDGGEAPTDRPSGGDAEYECPSCGKPVGAEDKQCPHCGANFSSE